MPNRNAPHANRSLLLVLLVLCGAACHHPGPSLAPVTDGWVGRWNGPEGTWLDIAGAGGQYTITVADLDGPASFEGSAQGATIVFRRDGQASAVQSTDGPGTGMKWLADRSDCLVIRPGEGFCRD